jgi:RNA-binding protein
VTRERELTGKDRSHLRALAHDLKPVVQIGVQGVTEGVLRAVDEALTTHELIKVRVSGEGGDLRAVGAELAAASRAHLAQVMGRMLLLFRRRKNKPVVLLPGEKPPRPRSGSNLQRTGGPARKKKRKARAERVKKVEKRRD